MSDEAGLSLRRPFWLTSWADCRQSGLAAFYRNELWEAQQWITQDLEYRREGYISVWVGTFPNERAFELYFKEAVEDFNLDEGEEDFCPLWDDLGFILPHEALRFRFFPVTIPVAELVNEMPYAQRFCGNLVAGSDLIGVQRGNAVLVVYGLDYSGLRTLACGCLQFVGSVRYV